MTRTQIVDFYNLLNDISIFTGIALLLFFLIKLYLRETDKCKQLFKKPTWESIRAFQKLSNFPTFWKRIQKIIEGLLLLVSCYVLVNTFVQVIPFYEVEYLYNRATIVEVLNAIETNSYDLFVEKSFTGTVAVGFLLIASLCFILSSFWGKFKYAGRIFVGSTLIFLFIQIINATDPIIDPNPLWTANTDYQLYHLDFTSFYLKKVLFSIPWYFGTFCLFIAALLFFVYLFSRYSSIIQTFKSPSWSQVKSIFNGTHWSETKNRISYLIFPPLVAALLTIIFIEPEYLYYTRLYEQNSEEFPLHCLDNLDTMSSYPSNRCFNTFFNTTILFYGLIILGFSGIWKWMRTFGWTIVAIIFPFLTILKILDMTFFD